MAIRCRSTAAMNPGTKRNFARRVRLRNPSVALIDSRCCPLVSAMKSVSEGGWTPSGSVETWTANRRLPSKRAARGALPLFGNDRSRCES